MGHGDHRATLLLFYAHWCPACAGELAELAGMRAELERAGLRVLALSVGTDPEERAQIEKRMAEVEARIEADMDPYVAARQLDTDEIVRVDELRDWLKVLVEMSYQGAGYRRMKNPRIWSMHDLDVLVGGGRT